MSFSWSNGEITEDIDTLIAGSYIVLIADTNGCVLQLTDTVLQPLAALSASAVLTSVYCANDSTGAVDLTVSGGTPVYQFNWSNGNSTEDIAMLIAGTYTVTITDSNLCSLIYIDSIVSAVTPTTLSYTSQNTVCINNIRGSIDVTASGGVQPFSYLWNTTDTIEDLTNLLSGSYSLTLTDSFNCAYSLTVNITDSSTLAITSTDTITCKGNPIDLTAPVNSFVMYQWLNGIDTITGGNNNIYAADSSGSYTLIATASCGTFTSNAINILVHPLPVISFTDSLKTTCDSAIVLNVSGGLFYSWLPATNLDNPTIPQPIATLLNSTIYIVTVTDSNGCSANANVHVLVNCDSLSVPGGFSPNGDGFNDLFVIRDIQNYPGNHLRIFNRWGSMVYDKTDYDNTWNGSSNVNLIMKGSMLPPGTYYYVLDLNNNIAPRTGFIVMKR